MEIQIRALVIISLYPGQCLGLEVLAAEVTVTVASTWSWEGEEDSYSFQWHRNWNEECEGGKLRNRTEVLFSWIRRIDVFHSSKQEEKLPFLQVIVSLVCVCVGVSDFSHKAKWFVGGPMMIAQKFIQWCHCTMKKNEVIWVWAPQVVFGMKGRGEKDKHVLEGCYFLPSALFSFPSQRWLLSFLNWLSSSLTLPDFFFIPAPPLFPKLPTQPVEGMGEVSEAIIKLKIQRRAWAGRHGGLWARHVWINLLGFTWGI